MYIYIEGERERVRERQGYIERERERKGDSIGNQKKTGPINEKQGLSYELLRYNLRSDCPCSFTLLALKFFSKSRMSGRCC